MSSQQKRDRNLPSHVYVSEETVKLYDSIPEDSWADTTELKKEVSLTRRATLRALKKLAGVGVIQKKDGSPGIATEVKKAESDKNVKSYKQKARSEPAGFYINNGYEVSSCSLEQSDSIAIHRLVAVAEYGFDCVANAEVHHINSIPWDNRPCNLIPLDQSEHRRRENLKNLIENADSDALENALRVKGYSDAADVVGGSEK